MARWCFALASCFVTGLGCGTDQPTTPADMGGASTSGAGAYAGGAAGVGTTAGAATAAGAGANAGGAAGASAAGVGASAGSAGDSASGGNGSAGSAGAANGPDVDVTNPQLHELELDPHELDATTADSPALQYAQLDTRATPLGKLVVFLPGANNVPRDWRDHGRQLASYGFHVLIPHYNNRWSTNGTCDGQGNTCNNDTRWEALVGEDKSAAVAIARADSAEGRVVTMLKHLLTAHAGGDWGFYLGANDAVLYDKMIIAGISHGAASAGMYAIGRPFTRAVLHSSGPAGNKSDPKMTPLSEWYAFTHTEDPAYDAITSAIANFEVPGDPTSIDGASAPFGESHRLITSAQSSYPHGSTCAHSSSPKDSDDRYLFDTAWRYLYGVPAL